LSLPGDASGVAYMPGTDALARTDGVIGGGALGPRLIGWPCTGSLAYGASPGAASTGS
jgi:hypothetical protein